MCDITPNARLINYRTRKNIGTLDAFCFSSFTMLISHRLRFLYWMTSSRLTLAVPLCTESTILDRRDTFDLFSSPVGEETSQLYDLGFSDVSQDAFPSAQADLFALSAGSGSCTIEETTPLSLPLVPGSPDLLDVFGIGGDNERESEVITGERFWDNMDPDPCRRRRPWNLHVCCNGRLGIFDGTQVDSIEECIISTSECNRRLSGKGWRKTIGSFHVDSEG